MEHKINKNIFRKYDIRGIVKNDFPETVVINLGKSFGTYLIRNESKTVSISGDVRQSTTNLKNYFIEGILSTGINVIDIGIVSTPINYYSMFCLDVEAAVQITGSHNPKEYNGFKFSYNKESFFGNQILELYELICRKDFEIGNGVVENQDIKEKYIQMLQKKINIKKPIHIAMDCGNAAGCITGPISHKNAGIVVKELYCDIDGNFPNHHPDPTQDHNLIDLINEMKKNKYDYGVAFDGDADRIVVIDERGSIIRSDILMALFVNKFISKGDYVVFDVKCSKALEEVITAKGGIPVMWKTGHSLIKQKMKELNVKLAGEMSGHIFFADNFFGFDDAVYASLRLAEILSLSKEKLSELIKQIPKYFSSPEIRIKCQNDNEKFKISDKAEKYYLNKYECNDIDGVRIKYNNGWALIRPSNTEPVIVCRFEASSYEDMLEMKNSTLKKLKEFGNIKIEC